LYVVWNNTPADSADSVLAQWQAYLIAAVYEGTATSVGAPSLGGVTYEHVASDGSVEYDGSGTAGGMDAANPNSKVAETSVTEELTTELQGIGLTIVSVDYETPSGVAPVVVAQSTDAAAVVKKYPRVGGILFTDDRSQVEGFYIEVLDENEVPFEADGYVLRSQTYNTWIRKDLYDPETMCGLGCKS
jgi:hypothetical protein